MPDISKITRYRYRASWYDTTEFPTPEGLKRDTPEEPQPPVVWLTPEPKVESPTPLVITLEFAIWLQRNFDVLVGREKR